MKKELISNKQGIAAIVMFILGSTMVLGTGSEAKQDSWIAVIIATVMAFPIVLVYSRVLNLFPGKNLYDIVEIIFGKFLGKVITVIYVWYSIHLGGLVFRNFAEYIQIVSLPETPQFVLTMLLGILCIYIVKSGIEVIGRWSILMAVMLILILMLINILSIPIMNFSVLKPVLYNGFTPVLKSATTIFAFPFGETVLFMTVLGSLQSKGNTYKVYNISLLIGVGIILLATIRNITSLGIETSMLLYFPVHGAVSLIDIGDFLQRVEVFISVVYLIAGVTKIGICLYSACTGFAKLFNLKDYKKIAAPAALISMNISCIIYRNTMEMFYWATTIYKYYAFPFQVIIPLVIWITAEIKIRTMKRNQVTL